MWDRTVNIDRWVEFAIFVLTYAKSHLTTVM